MYGNVGKKSLSFSMMQLSLDRSLDDVLNDSSTNDDVLLPEHTKKEVEYLSKMVESSVVTEREHVAREVYKVLRYVDTVGDEGMADDIMDVIERLSKDEAVSVQCTLLEQLGAMVSLCAKNVLFPRLTHSILPPMLSRALVSSHQHVRKNAIGMVGLLLEQAVLPQDVLLGHVLPALISNFSSRDGSESDDSLKPNVGSTAGVSIVDEQGAEAVSVMCRAVGSGVVRDAEWLRRHFIPPYSHLLHSSSLQARKAAVGILGELAKMFGEKFTVKFIVPHVVHLCKDEMWGVRKAVCEVFVDVAVFCPNEVRRTILAPRFVALLRDHSRWVSYVAFNELGPFISTFADTSVTGLMLRNGEVCSSTETEEEEEAESSCGECSSTEGAESVPEVVLPDGCFVPPIPHDPSKEEEDELQQTKALEALVDDEVGGARRSGSARDDGVAGRCHSLDDLSTCGVETKPKPREPEGLLALLPDSSDEEEEEEKMDGESSYYSNLYWNSTPLPQESIVPFAASFSSSTSSSSSSSGAATVSTPRKKRSAQFMEKRMDVLATPNSTTSSSTNTTPALAASSKYTRQIVPIELVELFTKMAVAATPDSDMNRQCAHNFPAVAFTLGRQNWSDLRDTYKALACDHQWRVRVTLAHSMHEMAAIVGEEVAEKDLLPVFHSLREDCAEVRGGLVKHLAAFYRWMPGEARKRMLKTLPHFLHFERESANNWRFRLEVANQLNELCDMFSVHEVNDVISGMALTLANDRVSDVRLAAAELMAKVTGLMVRVEWDVERKTKESEDGKSRMPLTDSFIRDLVRSFARSQRWNRRQTFTHTAERCYSHMSDEQYCSLILPHLLPLAYDAVPNIRVVVARALAHPTGSSLWKEKCDELLRQLAHDTDMDVAREARLAMGGDPRKEVVDVCDRGVRLAHREGQCMDAHVHSSSSHDDSSDMSISPNSSLPLPDASLD